MDEKLQVRIVPMTAEHLDEAAELERICFSTPWSRAMLAEELENDCSSLLAAVDDTGRWRATRASRWCWTRGISLNVAVRPECRRNGIAEKLLRVFLDFAQAHALAFLSLEVRASNHPAILLYSKLGFRGEGRRRNYYEHPREDAIIMTREFEQVELRLATMERSCETVYQRRTWRRPFPPAELRPLPVIKRLRRRDATSPGARADGGDILGELPASGWARPPAGRW
jgi:ribosomal-protein-alanine N-acetyltransferase